MAPPHCDLVHYTHLTFVHLYISGCQVSLSPLPYSTLHTGFKFKPFIKVYTHLILYSP